MGFFAGGVAQLGERLNGIQEVRGSIPLASIGCEPLAVSFRSTAYGPWPTAAARGNSSVGRAQPCQGWGRGFESRFPLQHSSQGVVALAATAPILFRFDARHC